jgi:PEP-CTERM motif
MIIGMRNFLTLTAAALLAVPQIAGAQATFTSNVANTRVTARIGTEVVNATYNYAPGGVPSTFSEQVGAFRVEFNMFGNAVSKAFCVDLFNTLQDASPYNVNVTLLSSSQTTLGNLTRQGQTLGGATAFNNYVKMAWLAGNFATAAQSEWAGIQGAIWNIQTGTPPSALNAGVATWLGRLASANLGTVNLAGWAIVSDVTMQGGNGGRQELLIPISVGVVPEPSTYALMATGLIGLVVIARRRRTV